MISKSNKNSYHDGTDAFFNVFFKKDLHLNVVESVFLLLGIFYLALLRAFSRLPWSRQFNLKVSRDSCWKIAQAWLLLWFTTIYKTFISGRFYLSVRAGWPRNIKLHRAIIFKEHLFYRTLVLQKLYFWNIHLLWDLNSLRKR